MGTTEVQPLPGTTIDPNCPSSDGRVMGESDYHIAAIIWLREALEDYFAQRADIYVASNMLLYFELAGARHRRDPDVLVVKGVSGHQRRSFRTWEEKTVPCVVFEISSENTWEVDVYDKPNDYRRLGIAEYFLFDPEHRYINPPLQGFRLVGGDYIPIPRAPDGSLTSQELGLSMICEGGMLRLVDSETSAPVLTRREAILEEQRIAEQARQRAAEQKRRADEQAQRADQQAQRANEQKQRADDLAAEVERLRDLLRQKDSNGGQG